MKETKSINLSSNAIDELQQLPYNGKSAPPKGVDMNLQIHTILKTPANKTSGVTYTATLADMTKKYCGFLIISKDNGKELNNGDIIKIKTVSIFMANNDKTKVFIVKSFEILAFNHSFLSNPEQNKVQTQNVIDINKVNNQEEDTRAPEPSNNDNRIEDQIHNNNSVNHSIRNSHDIGTSMLLSQITTFSKDLILYIKVIKKWEVKNFMNKQTGKPGKLFTFNIADIEGFEMQVTCFGLICDIFSNLIKEKGVYLIRGGYAKLSEKKYTNIKSDYKLIIDDKTRIEEMEDNGAFKETKINVNELKDLPSSQVNTIINCVVFVIEATEKTIKSTRGGEMSIRKLLVGDISGYKCELTLWRKFAEMTINQGEILFLKYVRVGDFNGRSLCTVDDSSIISNPIMPERNLLEAFLTIVHNWISMPNNTLNDSDQGINQINSIYLKDLLGSVSESNDSPLSKIKGTICTITHTDKNFYAGCPIKSCKKKLTQDQNGWLCLICNKKFDKPYYYYTISVRVKDASGEHWIDLFGETVTKLFGMKCEEYKDYISINDNDKLKQLTNKIEFQTYFFIGKAKVHLYNNNPKKKFMAYRYETVNKPQEARRQIKEIKAHLLI